MISPDTPVQNLTKIGGITAGRLVKLGIRTVNDLLYYFPFRYEDYTKNFQIKDLKIGDNANVTAVLILIQNRRSRQKRMNITEALFEDETGELKAVWFNQPYIARLLRVGDKVSLSGKIAADYSGKSIISPAYEKISEGADNENPRTIHTQGIVPVYPLTAGITQKQIRFLAKQSLGALGLLADWLPRETIARNGLLCLDKAVKEIHFPSSWQNLGQARDRLAFNELFLFQLHSQLIKRDIESSSAPRILFREQLIREFVKGLPFELTTAQRKAAWQILKDMQARRPMTRLLIGDVGSGKTVVAEIAILNALSESGEPDRRAPEKPKRQAVLMAPTEILARQHFNTIASFCRRYPLRIALFTRSDRKIIDLAKGQAPLESGAKASKPALIKAIRSGEADLVIGTHALIQEDVDFNNLALAVIDEQHRFGVEQRKKLIARSGLNKQETGEAGLIPHFLSMTATPIPRTLALALFSDLDVSVIGEMPKGRKPVITRLALEEKRQAAYGFIRERIAEGRQAFVVCPLIDESDKVGVKSVLAEYEKLQSRIFPNLKIAYLHGKLRAARKEEIMREFLANNISILVSTSVIEVGIDVPNATIMVVEGADRFGLAQLHQFRGRIGRGSHQSYCILFSDNSSPKTAERLAALASHNDGFELAKLDLKFRGPGEIFGLEQKGFPEFKAATLFDHLLLGKAKKEAEHLLADAGGLENWPALGEMLKRAIAPIHPE